MATRPPTQGDRLYHPSHAPSGKRVKSQHRREELIRDGWSSIPPTATRQPPIASPSWVQAIEQTFSFIRRHPLRALAYGICAALIAVIGSNLKAFLTSDFAGVTKQIIATLRGPRGVPRGSLSWNFSPRGTFDLQVDDLSKPIRISTLRASWPREDGRDMTTFPRLTYSMYGDFEASARVRIEGRPTVSGGVRLAGLGILSQQKNQMLLLGSALTPKGRDVRGFLYQINPQLKGQGFSGYLGDTAKCNGQDVSLKVIKDGSYVSVLCKDSRGDWLSVRDGGRFKQDFGDGAVQLLLFNYSADSQGADALFTQFEVNQR